MGDKSNFRYGDWEKALWGGDGQDPNDKKGLANWKSEFQKEGAPNTKVLSQGWTWYI